MSRETPSYDHSGTKSMFRGHHPVALGHGVPSQPGKSVLRTAKLIYCRTYTMLMTNSATFTKRVALSRNSFVIWIPRDVARLLRLTPQDTLEVKVDKIDGGETPSQ